MHYNPDEELASGIEHAAEHKVTKTIPITIRGSILPDLQAGLVSHAYRSRTLSLCRILKQTLNDVSLQYDYLIIFPVVKEGKQVREQHAARQIGKMWVSLMISVGSLLQADGSSVKNDTLYKWEDAKSLWGNSICGDDREKEEAITQLRAAWIR